MSFLEDSRHIYKFFSFFSGLTLNELLHYLEEDDDDMNAVTLNSEINIALMPPTNATGDITDEDSGDEDAMTVNNLPASQLLAAAEIFTNSDEILDVSNIQDTNQNENNNNGGAGDWDIEDDIPLHYYQASKKTFNWEKKDLDVGNVEWPLKSDCKPLLSPKQIFYLFFDAEIIEMFVRFTNEYALKKIDQRIFPLTKCMHFLEFSS